jgi:2,4-dienoyl-CoA reductase-like NADH-dependent reductase (Old Yellow Enzyme family)
MGLLPRIDRYLRHTGTPPTRFGREAVNDPRLVEDLRRGRELRPCTSARVERFLETSGW